jgi:hypothetical protein
VKPGRPSVLITIDGRELNHAESALVQMRIVLSLASHDVAELVFWPQTKFAGASAGSTISISAGEAQNEQDLLTGEVSSVRQTAAGFRIDAIAATVALNRTRKSQVYLSSSVADIIRDLASDISIDEVQGDLHLEAYSVDTRRTVWGYLLELASLSGSDVGSSASGGLRFVPVRTGSAAHTFRYGADMLSWQVVFARPFDPPKVAPHGAASEQGSSRWHWVLHDPVGGGGGPSRIVGAFHTRDAADQLQSAIKDRGARSEARGRLQIVGDPSVRPGELAEIGDFPGNDPRLLRVLEVRHDLNARGFITTLLLEGSGAVGGLGLSGLSSLPSSLPGGFSL